MRPIVADQNSLRNPLNEILGTQAQVRLLRVLANEFEGPLTAPNAAEHAGLTIPGVHKALKRLVQSGFVVRVGGGRKHQYELRRSDKVTPLYGVLPFPDNCSRKMYATPLTHEEKDQQMLELSRKLAGAIELDTSLVRRAKEHVQRKLKSDQGAATKDTVN